MSGLGPQGYAWLFYSRHTRLLLYKKFLKMESKIEELAKCMRHVQSGGELELLADQVLASLLVSGDESVSVLDDRVQCQLLSLLARVASHPFVADTQREHIVSSLFDFMQRRTNVSQHAYSMALDLLADIASDNSASSNSLIELMIRLTSSCATPLRVRCSALMGLAKLCNDRKSAQMTLLSHLSHADARVRVRSFDSVILWLSRRRRRRSQTVLDALQLASVRALYSIAVSHALDDDERRVRALAVLVVAKLAERHAEHRVRVEATTMRLVDDGFNTICAVAVNDLSVGVRARACSLLGTLRAVSARYLLQTLSKEVLRVESGAYVRLTRRHRDGGGARIALHAADSSSSSTGGDVEVLHDSELYESAAAGAFVHGLEDEFEAVRSAALDSLGALCLHSVTFARHALEFVVDMLNDEIDEVRINAIHTLASLGDRVSLGAEQLDIVLVVLDDRSAHVRLAAHRMLGAASLGTVDGVRVTAHRLLESVRRHPQDAQSIYACLRNLGASHAAFTELLVAELLGIDERALAGVVEPHRDDPDHIGRLVLVLAAASRSPTIGALLPPFVDAHHRYLADLYPSLFGGAVKRSRAAADLSPSLLARFESALQLVSDSDELERLADDERLSARCAFAASFLRCAATVERAKQALLGRRDDAAPLGDRTTFERLFGAAYRLQRAYAGLSHALVARLEHMRLFAHLMLCVLADGTPRAKPLVESALRRARATPQCALAKAMRADHEVLVAACQIADLLRRVPTPELSDCVASLASIKRTACILLSPRTSAPPIQFAAALPLRIDIDALLVDIDAPHALMAMASFDDGTAQLWSIAHADIEPIHRRAYRVRARMHLSMRDHSSPSSSSSSSSSPLSPLRIAINIVRALPPDMPSGDEPLISHPFAAPGIDIFDWAAAQARALDLTPPERPQADQLAMPDIVSFRNNGTTFQAPSLLLPLAVPSILYVYRQ
jgi:integrator complex subunit 4